MLLICPGSKPLFVREGLMALALLALALFPAVLGWWSNAARVPAVAIDNLLGGFPDWPCACGSPCRRVGLNDDWRTGARAMLVLAALLLTAQIALGG